MIGDEGFKQTEWNGLGGDSEFILSGGQDHD